MTDIEGPVIIDAQSQTGTPLTVKGYPQEGEGDLLQVVDGETDKLLAAVNDGGSFIGLSGSEVCVRPFFVQANGHLKFAVPGIQSVDHPDKGQYVITLDPEKVPQWHYMMVVDADDPVIVHKTRKVLSVELSFADSSGSPEDSDFVAFFAVTTEMMK